MKLTRQQNYWHPFDNFFDNDWLTSVLESRADQKTQSFSPAVDIMERNSAYVLRAELPGLTKEDIKVELHDKTLTLSGERQFSEEEKKDNYHRVERRFGKFYRQFTLPTGVDEKNVDAKFKDGVLEICLKKRQTALSQTIKIN